jgi:hypothetical protein
MTANTLLIAWGFILGVLFTVAFVWLPSRSRLRQRIDELNDIRIIREGYALAAEISADLTDAVGARTAARRAYRAVYPGHKKAADEAWVTWVQEGSPARYADRQAPRRRPRPTVQIAATAPAYHPVHLAADPDEPTTAIAVAPVWQPPDLSDFPQWGAPGPPEPAPWRLSWGLGDRLRLPLAWVFAAWDGRPRRYPWWRKLLDRAWEAGVVFEVSAERVNRKVLGWMTGVLGGLLVVRSLPARVRRAFPRRRARVGLRPKRYYPIKEG